jgi:hypothetical protein
MENFDRLVISLLDSEAIVGCFKKELAKELNVPVKNITGVWLENDWVNNVATQIIKVSFINVEIPKEKLMELPFKSIYENTIIFEVGDVML